ncbi:alpha/beta fold hydrolase [Amycolatopsis magusensis]|uniref:alpha/beta fold hydrolase n=1 Tax=Amycolatopsis magusensis TaxID=882444 RepID=UPI0037984DCE
MRRSDELGAPAVVELPQGVVRYFERGAGRPVVFVHGLLVNAELWRKVVPAVADAGFRCLAPDLPMGSHEFPLRPDAELSPPGMADLIADFLDALDLRDVLLVANDTGGAITQLLLTRRPERVSAVVFTPSDCFECFLPPIFGPLPKLARIPGFGLLATALLRVEPLQNLPFTFGLATKRPVDAEIVRRYLDPPWHSAGVRRDLRKFVRQLDNRHTLEAAPKLAAFDKPVLLAWATEDRLFPLPLGRRLAAAFPNARLVEIDDSYTFVPEDQPAVLAGHIVEFAGVMAD